MVMLQLSGSYGRVDDLPSFRRTVLLFSVFVSGSYARIRYVGWRGLTRSRCGHVTRDASDLWWSLGNLFLSPSLIGRVIYKFTRPARRMYRCEIILSNSCVLIINRRILSCSRSSFTPHDLDC